LIEFLIKFLSEICSGLILRRELRAQFFRPFAGVFSSAAFELSSRLNEAVTAAGFDERHPQSFAGNGIVFQSGYRQQIDRHAFIEHESLCGVFDRVGPAESGQIESEQSLFAARFQRFAAERHLSRRFDLLKIGRRGDHASQALRVPEGAE
jgi:hypothetical protein